MKHRDIYKEPVWQCNYLHNQMRKYEQFVIKYKEELNKQLKGLTKAQYVSLAIKWGYMTPDDPINIDLDKQINKPEGGTDEHNRD
jgi:hypothetical protein